jgi:hypothetical protein
MSEENKLPRKQPTLDDSTNSLHRLTEPDLTDETVDAEEKKSDKVAPKETKSGFIASLAARRKSVFNRTNDDENRPSEADDRQNKRDENLPSLLTQFQDTSSEAMKTGFAPIRSSFFGILLATIVFLIPAVIILATYKADFRTLIAYGNRNQIIAEWTEFQIVLETARWLIAIWLLGTLLPTARIFMIKIFRPSINLLQKFPFSTKKLKERLLIVHDTLLATEEYIAKALGMVAVLSCLVVLLPNSSNQHLDKVGRN